MRPITQGLIYRSACDNIFYLHQLLKIQRKKKQSRGEKIKKVCCRICEQQKLEFVNNDNNIVEVYTL